MRSLRTALLGIAAAWCVLVAAPAAGAAEPAAPAAAAAAARPDFRMPFSCGENWQLTTYSGHAPDDKKLDMFKVGGGTQGSTVVASAAGTVHQSFNPGGLEIDHGNGWFTVYLHMSDLVPVGTTVAAGQRIGTADKVGTGVPHLHYEQLYDSNGDGDGETDEMVHPVLQGTEYRLSPSGAFPTVVSTNACSAGGTYTVDTFADATGYAAADTSDPQGTLRQGTHYVYCKVLGERFSGSEGSNHWWLRTDLDEALPGGEWRNAYVPAYYLSRWGDDEARDNSGAEIPDC